MIYFDTDASVSLPLHVSTGLLMIFKGELLHHTLFIELLKDPSLFGRLMSGLGFRLEGDFGEDHWWELFWLF